MAAQGLNPKEGRDKRAADDLFRTFESLIKSGQLADGETLPPERVIVERFGVSRTVAREAILALSNKGLVEAKPRCRPTVKKPDFDTALDTVGSVVMRLLDDPEGVKNLFDTRTMIEAALARDAALNAKAEHLRALEEALEENFAAIEHMDQFFNTDVRFHRVFYHISGNPILPAVHRAYINWLQPNWEKMPKSLERNQRNYSAHKAMYQAVLSRDPDRAEFETRRHLKEAWQQIAKILEQQTQEQ